MNAEAKEPSLGAKENDSLLRSLKRVHFASNVNPDLADRSLAPFKMMGTQGLVLPPPSATGAQLENSQVELGKRLLASARDGDAEEVRHLMSKGAPFTTDWLGTSPLHLSAQYGHLETSKVLMRAGISKDARTKVDKTPLHLAASEGRIDVMELLLRNGAEVDAIDMLRMTPLHWAVERGNAGAVETLLRFGADISIESKFDKTPMEIASDSGRYDIMELLQNADKYREANLTTETMEQMDAITAAATQSILPLDDPGIIEVEGHFNHSIPAIKNESGSTGNTTEALKLLEKHGITMLPDESGSGALVNNLRSSGHTLTLTEAGKLALGTAPLRKAPTIAMTRVVTLGEANKSMPKPSVATPGISRIIKLTPQQFAALKAGKGATLIPTTASIQTSQPARRTLKIVAAPAGQSANAPAPSLPRTTTISIAPLQQSAKPTDPTQRNQLEARLKEAQKAADAFNEAYRKQKEEAERLKKQLETLSGGAE